VFHFKATSKHIANVYISLQCVIVTETPTAQVHTGRDYILVGVRREKRSTFLAQS